MLPGLRSQWATLISELPVHARDFLLGLGHRLRRPGDLLPQRLGLRLRLLGSLEPIGAVGVTVRHDRTDTLPDPVLSPQRMGSLGPHRGHIPSKRQGQQRSRAFGQYPSSAALSGQHHRSWDHPRFSRTEEARRIPGPQAGVRTFTYCQRAWQTQHSAGPASAASKTTANWPISGPPVTARAPALLPSCARWSGSSEPTRSL